MHASSLRIVCLGDSITDGNTYAQLIMQALAEARLPVPACICSGVSGHTAEQMEDRFDKTVAAFKPDLVTFSAGTNDAIRNVTPEQYEKSVRAIFTKIRALDAHAIVLTPCEYLRDENKEEIDRRLDRCETTLRQVAKEYGFPIAENRALMRVAVGKGESLMIPDGIHPNYRGQQLMARSTLDAMGNADVPLPSTFQPRLFPGVVKKWKVRLAPCDADGQPVRLTPETSNPLASDDSWQSYALPEEEPNAPTAELWEEQLRRNGFFTQLGKQLGKGPAQAWTEVHLEKARDAYAQISVHVATIWVNGIKVHDQGEAYNGNHAGKDRIPVTLQAGRNVVAIEIAGPFFYFGITPGLLWEDQLAAQYT